jgi:Na+-transporting NADH:ubiquinone oxidoreductase subunit NqrF
MRELEQRLPNFTFVPALSEPAPEDNWEGEVGLITDVVRRIGQGRAEQRGVPVRKSGNDQRLHDRSTLS